MSTRSSDSSVKSNLFRLGALLLAVLLLELILGGVLRFSRSKHWLNLSAARERRAQLVEGTAAEQSGVNRPAYMLPHPYLGFVLNPALDSPTVAANRGGHAINELGHVGDASPLWSSPEDTFVVAVFGGSVA